MQKVQTFFVEWSPYGRASYLEIFEMVQDLDLLTMIKVTYKNWDNFNILD